MVKDGDGYNTILAPPSIVSGSARSMLSLQNPSARLSIKRVVERASDTQASNAGAVLEDSFPAGHALRQLVRLTHSRARGCFLL